jgi:hypothetical protein
LKFRSDKEVSARRRASSLIVLTVIAGVDQVELVPHAVENAEGDREAKA